MKNILKFILFLAPWFLGSLLFPSNPAFYKSLNLPFFAPPSFLFGIVWPTLYILITITIYDIFKNKEQDKNYLASLISNYIINQLFPFFFFTLKSPFLGFVASLFTFITSIWLFFETKRLNDKNSKYLIPYLLWNLFATILSLSIYFMNF